MFKPFIYFPSNKVLSFILIASLLALPFVSAQGQTIIQSKPCFDQWPQTHAKCKGFILCDNFNRYTLVTGTAISAKLSGLDSLESRQSRTWTAFPRKSRVQYPTGAKRATA